MSIIRNRELSQFGSFIYIDNVTGNIGIATETNPYIGIGTPDPTVKLHVVGDTNLDGNLTVNNGNIEASSFTLNGNPLVEASIAQWVFGTGGEDVYRLDGSVGIGTSTISQRLTVSGNVSAGQFISTVTSGTAPLVVSSDTQVTNLNASFLRGKTPPSGSIVGTTDSQTLSSKTLTSPTINGGFINSSGISFNGSSSGSTNLRASATALGILTLPAATDTLVGRETTETLTNKTISAGVNTITGLTNSNLSGSAGITNANLENSTISGVSLGSTLANLTRGSFINYSSGTTYNGSAAITVSVAATTANTPNTLVARDISGDFTAGTITVTNLNVSNTLQAGSFNIEYLTGTDANFVGVITATTFVGSLDGTSTGLSGSPNIDVTDITARHGSFSGIVTATNIIATNGSFSGIVTALNFNTPSDLNLKENVKTVENSLDIVSNLRGVSFDWKEDGKKSYGIIAQELESVLPDLVSNGEIKTVNYNGIIAVLIESIKELKKEMEELKNN